MQDDIHNIKNGSVAATVHHIAAVVGVSPMTVSRALSGKGFVAKATRSRVLTAAEAVGYVPNISAKVLKKARTNVIGMLVTELRSPHIAQVVAAVGFAARRAGQDLFICLAAEDSSEQTPSSLKHLMSGICDGLLMALPKSPKPTLELIARSGIPTVLLNYELGNSKMAVVRGDNYWVAREAIEHLLNLGHKRIAFIAGSSFSGQSPERERAYVDALVAAHVAIDPALIVQGEFHQTVGFARALELLALSDRPTAIFAANDEMALGVIDAARQLGLQIPADLSLIGFDDIPAASYVFPGLSTVRQAVDEIAFAGVRALMRQIDTKTMTTEQITLASQLVIRGSTGPCKEKRDEQSSTQ
ncbi:MAG: LacI family DNA-binding transcriptional regulator [Burkholderiales bacterium]